MSPNNISAKPGKKAVNILLLLYINIGLYCPFGLLSVSLMDSLESTMNTTTSPQVGKGTLRDAGILEQDEDDNDNARYRQSMTDFMKTAGTGYYIL